MPQREEISISLLLPLARSAEADALIPVAMSLKLQLTKMSNAARLCHAGGPETYGSIVPIQAVANAQAGEITPSTGADVDAVVSIRKIW
jgi:hypothetical protein